MNLEHGYTSLNSLKSPNQNIPFSEKNQLVEKQSIKYLQEKFEEVILKEKKSNRRIVFTNKKHN